MCQRPQKSCQLWVCRTHPVHLAIVANRIPKSTHEDVMMHVFYYVPMTVNTNHPPLLCCHNFCSGWRHTLFARTPWGSGRHSHFPFIKLNSHESFWPVTMTVKGCCLLVHHDKAPTPRHPPLALSLMPTSLPPPSHGSAASWIKIKPQWKKD